MYLLSLQLRSSKYTEFTVLLQVQCGFLPPFKGPVFRIWLLGTKIQIHPTVNTVQMFIDVKNSEMITGNREIVLVRQRPLQLTYEYQSSR